MSFGTIMQTKISAKLTWLLCLLHLVMFLQVSLWNKMLPDFCDAFFPSIIPQSFFFFNKMTERLPWDQIKVLMNATAAIVASGDYYIYVHPSSSSFEHAFKVIILVADGVDSNLPKCLTSDMTIEVLLILLDARWMDWWHPCHTARKIWMLNCCEFIAIIMQPSWNDSCQPLQYGVCRGR